MMEMPVQQTIQQPVMNVNKFEEMHQLPMSTRYRNLHQTQIGQQPPPLDSSTARVG
jgi:hypothetical protein